MYIALLYIKAPKDDPNFNGPPRGLECFVFTGAKPNDEEIIKLKSWYLHYMYPSEKEEDVVCEIRGSRPSQFECPADFIVPRSIDLNKELLHAGMTPGKKRPGV